jgi:hypothetical protein
MDFVYLYICVSFTGKRYQNQISSRGWGNCHLHRLDQFYLVFETAAKVWYLRYFDAESILLTTEGKSLRYIYDQ